MRVTVREAAEALEADGAVLFAVEDDQLFVADAWPGDAAAAAELRIPVGYGVAGLVARHGRPELLPADEPRNPHHRALLGLGDGAAVSRVVVPVRGLREEVVGVLALHRDAARPFDDASVVEAERRAAGMGVPLHSEQLWQAVHSHRDERDRLIAQAISAQESERRRIAFDLHDGVTTVLASMAFHLDAAALAVDALPDHAAAAAREQIAAARRLADLAYDQTRAAVTGLHSLVLEDLGLVAALESLVQAGCAGLDDAPDVELLTDPPGTVDALPDHAAAALYRIAQEAIGNALRHAHATRVVVSLRTLADAVVLGVTDDGVGFDAARQRSLRSADGQHHYGLSSIEERCALVGARLRVESLPGRGTTVLVELPLG